MRIILSFMITILLLGCNPFETEQKHIATFVDSINQQNLKINQAYQINLREIAPYQPYHYQHRLRDPFQQLFTNTKETPIKITRQQTEITACTPPDCVPPAPHRKALLENYNLHSLVFVGTLSDSKKIALIRTPDYGTVQVHVGDYIGENNGRIIEIKDYSLVLQEKIYNDGLWQNRETILTIQ